jgi:maleamate amidohydrolase
VSGTTWAGLGRVENIWLDLLSEEERVRLKTARFGLSIGLGERPAILVIDAQNYMVGPPPGAPEGPYPSACGEAATQAINRLVPVLSAARATGVPIFYTRFALQPDGRDIGVYGRKRELLHIDGWCLEGSTGAEIVPALRPEPDDFVLVKTKPSAFIGTPLLGLLVDRGVDTLLVAGGATSNCVRATVVDAMSYNYRTTVVWDCVFDRFAISHRVALFDLGRQYADLLDSESVTAYLYGRQAKSAGSAL